VANAQASAADLASARLSAQAELAADYFQLRSLDAQARLFAGTTEQYRRALQIAQNQYNAGIVARSDVVTALTQLQTTQAQAVDLGVRRAQLEHAIAVLTGAPPADLTLPPGPLAARVPVAPSTLPSTLLERRPDIAAAERRMQQQNALIGVAVAAYYPDISLSAALSYAGHPLSSLISTSNEVWTLAASATQTLFEGGLRGAQVEAARAAYDQSVAAYRQTVLGGFQEVEDQLAALRILQEEAKAEDAAVRSAREAVQLTLNEYRAGTVAFTTVITAQTTLLADERAALAIQEARLVASVSLIQALGGGWDAALLPAARSF
jgi:NodT family efflux transporter outer membrane factor (OMF) lipoprotein